MEKLYRILKILILVLLAAVVVVGAIVFMGQPEAKAPQVSAEAADPNSAPDFTLYDLDGNTCRLSDFQGQPVVLNFWASWCGPCKAEMPDLEAAYQTYGEQVRFVMVNLTDGSSETVESASTYIASQGYSFPVYYDVEMEGAMAYSVYAIPVTYFIDSNGVIRATNEGMISANALEDNIRALLAQ